MMVALGEGRDFPGALPELRAWLRSDADCVNYLDWLRWPDGFAFPWCAGAGDWSTTVGLYRCSDCGRGISLTSQTLFHRTRTPLTVRFEAVWLMMASKQGLSALNLQWVTDLGSYQTAWTMTHKLRTVMSQSGRNRLTGRIEIDATYVGGTGEPSTTGRGAAGKTLVEAAVELNARRGHAGAIREDLSQIELVELKHERSRSLDPHKHRHLWSN